MHVVPVLSKKEMPVVISRHWLMSVLGMAVPVQSQSRKHWAFPLTASDVNTAKTEVCITYQGSVLCELQV